MWEYHMRLDGFKRSEDRAWYKIGALAALMLSPYSKKKLQPEDLLNLDGKKRKMSKERIKADVENKMKAYRKHKQKAA